MTAASVFAWGIPAAASAASASNRGGTVIEVFSNDGQSSRRVEALQPSDVSNRGTTENGKRGFMLASPENVDSMRASIRRLLALPLGVPLKDRKAHFSLSLAVLDAMSAASEAEAHQLLARLPIRVERLVGTATVTTSVYVRDNIKFRVTTPLPATRSQDDVDTLSASGGPNAYASLAPYGFSQSGCQDDPEDPCATQQEIDDVLAAEAALQTDLDSLTADFNADEAACRADGWCSGLLTASGPSVERPSCAWRYLEAATGIAWAASGIAGAVAVTVSPEPVSKLAIFAAYSNAVAGVGAAVLGVRDAWECHCCQIYAPLYWIAPRTGAGGFGLSALTAMPAVAERVW